jgi:DNA polymerase-3 subunit gamma/tau
MAHRALTLKYRPQVFADMIGQDHVSRVLARAVESGRIAHAYLFTGARGVGKTTSARILAKALNCTERRSGALPGAEPCNRCTSCLEITNGSSLDVSEIDGASNRGIADVQALREKVHFSPTGGGYRVVIIDEVHQLSNDAFAALLKTLEEPPPHLVFVFATTDPQKLPDTIRSRTQRFDFARVPMRKIADRLLAITAREAADPEGLRFELAEDAALLIAHKSEGSVRDAVSALDQVVSAGEAKIDAALVRRVLGLADREVFFALGGAILSRDSKAALASLHRAYEAGLDARDLAEGLTEHVRHLLILRVDPEGSDLVPAGAEELSRMRDQAEGWSEADLLRLLRIASDVQWPLRESPQPLFHLEAAVVQMATLEKGDTLAEVIGRLEALEDRLRGADAGPERSASGGARSAARGSAAPASAPRPAPAPGPSRGAKSGGSPRAELGDSPWAATPAGAPLAGASLRVPPLDVPPPAAEPREAGSESPVATAEAPSAAPDDILGLWKLALEAVGQRKRMLGAFLEACRFVSLEEGRMVLAMDDLHRAVLDEKENRTIALEEIGRAFGRPIELRCLPLDAAAAPAAPPPDVKPMIENAIRWFQGDIIERSSRSTEERPR